jgi:hypothetical protein
LGAREIKPAEILFCTVIKANYGPSNPIKMAKKLNWRHIETSYGSQQVAIVQRILEINWALII